MTTTPGPVVPLLVFEAADCLMAIVAAEVGHLEKRFRDPFSADAPENGSRNRFFDLGEYFTGSGSDGPWLHWARGTQGAWLRVRRVIDVVPVSLGGLTPMPAVLRGQTRTHAFLAAGLRNDEVFLLLDPGRLTA
jgi:hypothetical protein